MAATGWIVTRAGPPRAYYTVLNFTETWTASPALAYMFATHEDAARVAYRMGGRAEPVGNGEANVVALVPKEQREPCGHG